MNHLEDICRDSPGGLLHDHLMDWLGAAMKLRAACMCCEQPFTVSEDESAQDIARRILSRTIALTNYPWFTRLWVVQEVALGVSATLYCGAYYAPWRAFKELLDQTRTPLMQTHVAIAAVEPVVRSDMDSLSCTVGFTNRIASRRMSCLHRSSNFVAEDAS